MKADDFARGAVSGSAAATGLHLGLIIVGGTIGFAVFVISSQIGGALGYAKAGLAFAIGSLILGFMGAVTSYVGAKSRLSTYLLTEFAFGPTGAKIANLVVALSLVGWFGVICNTLGLATQEMMRDSWNIDVPPPVVITAASALMISVTAAGFTGIDRLALFLTPFMALLIGYAAFLALRADVGEPLAVEQAFTFQTAVSAVVGTYIVGVIIQPDYSRFAVNVRHAVWSVFIALALFFPLVQFFSAVPSMATGEPSVVLVMSGLGIIVPAFFLLFLGAWSSNVLCLYSSSLSVATLMERARLSHIIIAIGVAGTALAYVMVQEAIVDYLVLLGITIPPIGAIYIVEAIFVRRFQMDLEELNGEPGFNIRAFGAWAGAIAVGYCSDQELMGIVGIASIDSLIVASALYAAFQWRHGTKVN
ncbi:MAG: cytosine permease [Gammaproteobacteria bacterium]|nr:cytosine permease [Gammaproteobacteria bacterium]